MASGRLTTLAFGLASLIASCSSDDGSGLQRVVPLIELDAAAVDFGEVPVGATRRIAVPVRNVGLGVLTLAGVDAAEPFGAELIDVEIPAGGTGIVDLWFRPINDENQSGTLMIASDSNENPMLSVGLTGVGVAGAITVAPTRIDLNGTTVGTTRTVEIEIANLGIEIEDGRIATERFSRPEHYALTGLTRIDTPGTYAVSPRGRLVLDLEYQPLTSGDDSGRILFETCGERCGIEVPITASGVDATLRLDPPAIDFGPVGIQLSKSQTVTVINDGDRAVEITRAETSGEDFQIRPPVQTPFSVAAKSNAVINIEFTPREAGTSMGELLLETSNAAVARARVRLVGRGEGPLFEVQPALIDFGIQRRREPTRRPFLMLNAGSADVRIENVLIAGDPTLSLSGLPGLPIRLAAGESITASVQFEPAAEGMFAGTVIVETDDVAAQMVEIPVSAAHAEQSCELETTPGRLNFGLNPVGHRRLQGVQVENVGNAACTVMSGAFETPPDAAFEIEAEPWPLNLAPGDVQPLTFAFAPTDARPAKTKYILTTSDAVFPTHAIGLVGSSRAYDSTFVLPPQLDFGQSQPGCSAGVQALSVFNTGANIVTVESVTITSTSSEFSVVNAPNLPFVIGAGGSEQIDIGYTPSDFGRDDGEIEIRVADLPFPLITPIRGRGTNRPAASDTFQQLARREVDVLFVVDNSCSMFDEQLQLGQNFSSFIRTANIRSIDFRIGVTTTDVSTVGERGGLVGPVLSRGTNGLERQFEMQAVRGINGSGRERGLEAMFLAFELANNGHAPNSDLFRSTAALVVIIISDEDDQSSLGASFYFNELRTRARNGFTAAVVSGQTSGCRSATFGSASPARKYEQFLSLSRGVSESICAQNWAGTLANIGSVAFGLRDRFLLSQPADTTQPITVMVNGAIVPQTDWSYDPTDDSVNFVLTAVPPENSTVQVDYVPTC